MIDLRYLGFLILGLTCIVTVLFIIAFSVVTNDRDMDYLYMVIFFAVLGFGMLYYSLWKMFKNLQIRR